MSDPGFVVVAAAVLRKAVAAVDGAARERLLMMMAPGDRQGVWVDTPTGRVKVGSVTLTEPAAPRTVRKVTDPAVFLAWVKQHRPEEVIHIETVRTSYETAVLGGPEADDNGVVIDNPPGVEWVETSTCSVIQVRTAADAHATITAAVAAGTVALDDVLALPGGGS